MARPKAGSNPTQQRPEPAARKTIDQVDALAAARPDEGADAPIVPQPKFHAWAVNVLVKRPLAIANSNTSTSTQAVLSLGGHNMNHKHL